MNICTARKPDLHIHTTASDGTLKPAQVVEKAEKLGINLLSVTDHDTIAGLKEATVAATEREMFFLPGVEISAEDEEEVHILGYGVNEKMKSISTFLHDMREERDARSLKIVSKLRSLGININDVDLPAEEGTSRGRAQIARVLVAKAYADSMNQAFERYLSLGAAAYVVRQKTSVSYVISLLRENGVVPVLAHPGLIRLDRTSLLKKLSEWIKNGLLGLEAYHPSHIPESLTFWNREALTRGLIVTGGSDFHSEEDHNTHIGKMLPFWTCSERDTRALFESICNNKGEQ